VIACVAPNPSIDRLFEVGRLQPGRIHRPTGVAQVPGGKGLNVARAAAALGADVHAVALLGGHAGRWIADSLDVPLTVAWHGNETRTCLSVADDETGSLTEFYEAGASVAGADWDAFAKLVRDAGISARWTTISGSLPPGAPADGYEQLVAASNVAVDTTALGRARPALVKVNAAEASTLTGLPVGSVEDALAAARALRLRLGGDGHAAAVTCGDEGALLVAPDGRAWRGSLEAGSRYPVGSGDAFLAGLVTALERDEPWEQALRAAIGAAAANAELPGAGILDPGRARSLAGEAVVRAVAPEGSVA
jgi:1-phosphofructokinase family hexose kinase